MAQAKNAREAECEPTFMPVRTHNIVEGHFQHHLRLHGTAIALIVQRVGQKPRRQFGDLSVSQAGICLPYVEQLLAITNREGVITQYFCPFRSEEHTSEL